MWTMIIIVAMHGIAITHLDGFSTHQSCIAASITLQDNHVGYISTYCIQKN